MRHGRHALGPKSLVLFDLDGVLLDSRENMRLAWAEVCRRLDCTIPFADYFREIGRPFGEIMRRIGFHGPATEAERIYRVASMKHIDAIQFFAGTEEALTALAAAGIGLGIVTSKDELRTNAIIAMLPVTFRTVRTPNKVHRGKPAPDHILVAMGDAGTDPAESVYIGDMEVDFVAARRAGIDYAHAAWGYGPPPVGCPLILSRIADLPAALSPAGAGGRD